MHFLFSKHFCLIFLCFSLPIYIFGQADISFKEMDLVAQSKFIEEHQDATDISSLLNTYLTKAITSKNQYHEANAYYHFCLIYRKKKNAKRAHDFIDKAIAIAKQRKDRVQLGIFIHRKGTVFYVHADNTQALDYYLEAYELLKNDTHKLQLLLNLRFDIATIKLKAKHYNEALTRFESLANTYDSLLQQQPNVSYYKSYIHILLGLAEASTENGTLEKAMLVYEKAIRMSISCDYDFGTHISLGGKAKVLNRKKEYSKALFPVNEAIAMASADSNSKGVLPFLYAHKGESYFGLKDYKKAVFNLSKADSIVKVDSLHFIELDYILKLLAKSYSNLKNYKKANQYFNEYSRKNDLNTKERIQLRETLFNNYDLQKITDKLAEEKEAKGLFKNRFHISVFVVLCLFMALLFFVIYHQYKQRKNRDQFETFMKALAIKETEEKKAKPSFVISDDTFQEILQQLNQFETDKMYLNKKYNLATLAKKFDTNSNYLSKVINTYKQKTFSQYLNDLRIDFIITELKNNKKIRSYTIQAIAEEAGFNKAESFSKAFKKKTGFNPSFYIKNLKN